MEMTNLHSQIDPSGEHGLSELFGHPDEVLVDARLSVQQKRALLASWASDANAVPHVPSLRQLPDGSVVDVSEILSALKALDRPEDVDSPKFDDSSLRWRPLQLSFKRRRGSALRKENRYGRRRDDHDDPPPCPANAALLPRRSGGAAVAIPEPIMA